MSQEKTSEERIREKEQMKADAQKTENIFEDQSRVKDEQNRLKTTENQRR